MRILIAICLLFLVLVPLNSETQMIQDTTNTYYFFSENRQAFVVGSITDADLRRLVEFTLPQALDVTGPGWSASGEWFAWLVTNRFSASANASSPNPQALPSPNSYIFGKDETEITELSRDHHIQDLFWAPNSDHLAALYYADGLHLQILQVGEDPMTIFEWNAQGVYEAAEWLELGDIFSVTWKSLMPTTEANRFAVDSNHVLMVNLENGAVWNTTHTDQPAPCQYRPAISSNGSIAYLSDHETLILENPWTDTRFSYVFDGHVMDVIWSASGQEALIYTNSTCSAAEPARVTLFSYDEPNFRFVSDGIILPMPVSRAAIIAQRASRLQRSDVWSPNGLYAFLPTTDGVPILLEVATFELSELSNLPEGRINHHVVGPSHQWSPGSDELIVAWGESGSSYVDLYGFDESDWQHPRWTLSDSQPVAISPSTGVVAQINCGVENAICFRDFISDEIIANFQLALPSQETIFITEVIWHPSENIAFVLAEVEPLYRDIYIVDLNNQRSRYLGECNLSYACFGWYKNN